MYCVRLECPQGGTKRSRPSQWGQPGRCAHDVVVTHAAGARLIAVPGWPLPVFWTASAARTRAVSTARISTSDHPAFFGGGRASRRRLRGEREAGVVDVAVTGNLPGRPSGANVCSLFVACDVRRPMGWTGDYSDFGSRHSLCEGFSVTTSDLDRDAVRGRRRGDAPSRHTSP